MICAADTEILCETTNIRFHIGKVKEHDIILQCYSYFDICHVSNFLNFCKSPTARGLIQNIDAIPDSKVHGANVGPTWVLSAPEGPHIGPMNLAIRDLTSIGNCIVKIRRAYDHLHFYFEAGPRSHET